MPNSLGGDRPPASTTRQATDDARAAMVRALAAVEVGERNSLERLRGSLCALVRSLRESGASKEEVIEVIRGIVATPVAASARFGLLHPARIALIELSINWCVEEYDNWRRATRADERPASPEGPGDRHAGESA